MTAIYARISNLHIAHIQIQSVVPCRRGNVPNSTPYSSPNIHSFNEIDIHSFNEIYNLQVLGCKNCLNTYKR
jgi:hypothetical protein